MSWTLRNAITDFLESHPDVLHTAKQLAEYIVNEFPEHAEAKKRNNKQGLDDKGVKNQYRAEIGAHFSNWQNQDPNLKVTEGKPRHYYWTARSDEEEVAEAEPNQPLISNPITPVPLTLENDLYPKVSEYLWSDLRVYSMRIDEKRSSNKQGAKGNKWLYPDIVGMEDLTKDWHDEIKGVVKEYADRKTKLWSLEVKTTLNRSNVRESYFQAVSNSSWANYGYLAAEKIDASRTMKEFKDAVFVAWHWSSSD